MMFEISDFGVGIAVYVRTACASGDEDLEHVEGRELHLRYDDLGKVHA